MKKFEILLSCMGCSDGITQRSGITSDTLIIDQCGKNGEKTETLEQGNTVRIIYSAEKGLTKSRNLAIKSSDAEICLLCDDDEVFVKDCETGVLNAYEALPQADIIIFDIVDRPAKWGSKIKKLGKLDIMRVSSWQISFRREALIRRNIRFDENMGAGTGNGAEEEFKFLTDCRKAGLAIYYYPFAIASVAQTASTWFKGYDETFFVNRGNTTRYIMGLPLSLIYALYYSYAKRGQFKDLGMIKAFSYTCRGIRENRLSKLKKEEKRRTEE